MGLQVLNREKKIFMDNPNIQPDLSGSDYVVERQLKPEARGEFIAALETENILPTSMIDISDGLASELFHLCTSSGKGCRIYEEKIPIDFETATLANEMNINPLIAALSGGEDYELLFTILPSDKNKVNAHPDICIIGEILDENLGVKLFTKGGNYHDIISLGWNSLKDEE